MYEFKYMESPVGKLTLIACSEEKDKESKESGLVAVLWEDDREDRVHAKPGKRNDTNSVLVQTEQQLKEYFEGKRKTFSIPLHPIGTDFQKQVWTGLTTIPYGETRSYGQLASQIGNPKAVRAVGAANGKNPISIIVPCHRVIGSSGNLTGFAGGLDAKAKLLELEGVAFKR